MKKVMIIFFSAVIFLVLGLYIAGNLYFTDARICEENFNIALPSDLKQVYSAKSRDNAFGEGYRYTIYEIKRDDVLFLEGSSAQKDDTMQNKVIKILALLQVENQRYPDFSHEYKWRILTQRDSILYIICDTESSSVYFVQDIK